MGRTWVKTSLAWLPLPSKSELKRESGLDSGSPASGPRDTVTELEPLDVSVYTPTYATLTSRCTVPQKERSPCLSWCSREVPSELSGMVWLAPSTKSKHSSKLNPASLTPPESLRLEPALVRSHVP